MTIAEFSAKARPWAVTDDFWQNIAIMRKFSGDTKADHFVSLYVAQRLSAGQRVSWSVTGTHKIHGTVDHVDGTMVGVRDESNNLTYVEARFLEKEV